MHFTRLRITTIYPEKLASEDWGFVDEGVSATFSIRELDLDPPGVVFIHKTHDLDGKIFYWHVSVRTYWWR